MATVLGKAVDLFLLKVLSLPFLDKLPRVLFPTRHIIRSVDPVRDLDTLAACGVTLSSNSPETIREDFRLELTDRDPQRWLFLIAENPKSRVLGFARAMRQPSCPDRRHDAGHQVASNHTIIPQKRNLFHRDCAWMDYETPLPVDGEETKDANEQQLLTRSWPLAFQVGAKELSARDDIAQENDDEHLLRSVTSTSIGFLRSFD